MGLAGKDSSLEFFVHLKFIVPAIRDMDSFGGRLCGGGSLIGIGETRTHLVDPNVRSVTEVIGVVNDLNAIKREMVGSVHGFLIMQGNVIPGGNHDRNANGIRKGQANSRLQFPWTMTRVPSGIPSLYFKGWTRWFLRLKTYEMHI